MPAAIQTYKPYPYQAYSERWIVDRPAAALWLDMGLGKTVITLTAINELKYERFQISKVLVIAPKKVAEATWQNEAKKWAHTRHLTFSTVLGSRTRRVRAVNTPADIYVINRDNVCWLVEYYRNDWPFDMVILDESTSFKNQAAKRWKALKSIRAHISRVVELTGTPSPQGLLDLWPQMYLLDQGQRLGKTVGAFRERYFDPDKRDAFRVFTYRPKDGAEQSIRSLLGDVCLSMRAKDYLDLPDLVSDQVPVVLDAPARRAYTQLEREAVLQVDETMIDAGMAATLTGKLLQLCNGAVYDGDRLAHEIHRCKIEAFMELVEGLGDAHALVFYNFQHDRDRLLQALQGHGKRVRVYHDAQDEKDWNEGRIDILLAHPASCAYGLNLQFGGHHIVWFGLTWSLELYQQGNKRLHRQGQDKPVIVHQLVVQDAMDEDVLASLEDKAGTQEGLMRALRARVQKIKKQGAKIA